MGVKHVLRMGDPRLLAEARPVESFGAGWLLKLVTDMKDTMRDRNGAGLAAPQIGVPLRVVIFGVHANPRYPGVDEVPDTTLINPEIEIMDKEMEYGWEGCLSLPGLRGLVPRYRVIRYRGLDEQGEIIERVASGFHARVVQHECDHLDGVLFPMRMDDLSRFGFEDVLPVESGGSDKVGENINRFREPPE
jgi:peptide deformylase